MNEKETQNIAVIVAHGMGEQHRFDQLKEVVTGFWEALKQDHPGEIALLIDREELHAEWKTLRDGGAFGAAKSIETLFRPATVVAGNRRFRFYEIYWADEDFEYSAAQKVAFNVWILTTLWNPFFNYFSGKYDSAEWPVLKLARSWFYVLFVEGLYHLMECVLLLVGFVPGVKSLARDFGKVIYAYAGDVKLYVSQKRFFHNQTKREAILSRFDEVAIKAYVESDEMHFIGHSLGSKVVFDGLMKHEVQPSKTSAAFRAWLTEQMKSTGADVLQVDFAEKLKTLTTAGSPLDKFAYFWPSQTIREVQPSFKIIRQSVPGDPVSWTARPGAAHPTPSRCSWLNVFETSEAIGAKLDHYSRIEGFPHPDNLRLARYWLPSSAHTEYFRNPAVMRGIARRILGAAEPRVPVPASSARAFAHLAWTLTVTAGSVWLSLRIIRWLAPSCARVAEHLLGFAIGSEPAKHWASVLGRFLSDATTSPLIMGMGLVGLALVSLPPALILYRRAEAAAAS